MAAQAPSITSAFKAGSRGGVEYERSSDGFFFFFNQKSNNIPGNSLTDFSQNVSLGPPLAAKEASAVALEWARARAKGTGNGSLLAVQSTCHKLGKP